MCEEVLLIYTPDVVRPTLPLPVLLCCRSPVPDCGPGLLRPERAARDGEPSGDPWTLDETRVPRPRPRVRRQPAR